MSRQRPLSIPGVGTCYSVPQANPTSSSKGSYRDENVILSGVQQYGTICLFSCLTYVSRNANNNNTLVQDSTTVRDSSANRPEGMI
jgi:hypothetical protein